MMSKNELKTQSHLEQDTSDLVSDFISSLVDELREYSNKRETENKPNVDINTTTIGILPNGILSHSHEPKCMIFVNCTVYVNIVSTLFELN